MNADSRKPRAGAQRRRGNSSFLCASAPLREVFSLSRRLLKELRQEAKTPRRQEERDEGEEGWRDEVGSGDNQFAGPVTSSLRPFVAATLYSWRLGVLASWRKWM